MARLKGTMQFAIRARSRTWESPVSVGQAAIVCDLAGRTMIVEGIEKKGLNYSLQWSLFRNGTSAVEWNKLREITAPGVPDVRLLDAHDHFLARYNRSTEIDADHVTCHFDFRKDRRGDPTQAGDPARLVWEEVQETREITLPFEFTDLPLP
jgi:hypothetical protein